MRIAGRWIIGTDCVVRVLYEGSLTELIGEVYPKRSETGLGIPLTAEEIRDQLTFNFGELSGMWKVYWVRAESDERGGYLATALRLKNS